MFQSCAADQPDATGELGDDSSDDEIFPGDLPNLSLFGASGSPGAPGPPGSYGPPGSPGMINSRGIHSPTLPNHPPPPPPPPTHPGRNSLKILLHWVLPASTID